MGIYGPPNYSIMKKTLVFSVFILLLAVFTACQDEEAPVKAFSDKDNQVSFSLKGEKTITVDDRTDWNLYLPQPFTVDGTSYLLSLDKLNNAINMYDYEAGQLHKRIAFPFEGENSIPTNIIGYQALSTDSLLIIDKIGRLYFTDFEAQVHQAVDLDPNGIPGQPFAFPNSSPLQVMDGKVIVENYYLLNENRQMKVALDLADLSLSYQLTIPSEYIEGYWGVGDFKYYNHVYNAKTQQYVYNFPNREALYVYDKNLSSPTLKPVVSRKVASPADHILVMGKQPSPELLERGPLRSSIYARLLYDPWREVYYRIVGHPIKESVLEMRDPVRSTTRTYSVIVLNEDFEWLGEFDLPAYEYPINIEKLFINEKGLHFQKESINEDLANFDIWNID